ncbi:jacalin-like lectin [Paraburkholderia mimosarum]|uniref:jacalin-like lectin n=1 Tax=Paraburkholderia mimosarum TaxID=312026 RepID=UPI0039C1AFF9
MNVQTEQKLLETATHPSAPVSLRQGYDSVTGAGRSTAIIGESEETGSTSTLTCTVCTSVQQLTRALEIDQSLAVAYGPFGSVDQKLDFVRNLDITTTSISIVVYCRHIARVETLKNAQLDPNIDPPTDTKGAAKFFNAFGDSFLSSRTLGGEYCAVYTFYANDSEQQTNIKASLQASGIYSGVSIDANFQAHFDEVVKTSTTRTDFSQSVSGIENPSLPKVENIVDFAIKFTSVRLDMQAVIDFGMMGYENVAGLQAMKALVANRAYFNGDSYRPGLASKLADLVTLRNKITDLAGTYAVYGATLDPKLSSVQSQVQNDINAISNQIAGWEDDPTQTFPVLPLDSLKNGTPSLSVSVNTFGPYGGDGGGAFDDILPNALEFVSSRTHLTSVTLHGGRYVDALITSYQCEGQKWSYQRGGAGGGDAGTLAISPSNPVYAVSGRSGRYVDHLTLSATSVTLSAGGSGGSDFPNAGHIPANNFLLGFRGRSGRYLDQISIVYAGFNPVVWQPMMI